MARVKANGIEIEYDTLGNPADPAILLVMGFSGQMTRWPDAFKRRLAESGRHVIWFDNRDVGLTTEIASKAPPSPMEVIQAVMSGQNAAALVPYTLSDMAADSAALLDALDIGQADILGVSMGGMIAQLMALDHAHKVRKLLPVMTTSGDPLLPPGKPEALAALTQVPASRTPEAIADAALAAQNAIGSHPDLRSQPDEIRARAIRDFHRSDRPFGVARQYAAILAQPRWHDRLGEVTHPTLVLHGADDPLILPAAGADIARRVPGAAFHAFPKWGHDIPDSMISPLIDKIEPFLRS